MWLPPAPFLIGAANIPFAAGGTASLIRKIPPFATWRLKYPLVVYQNTEVANAQTSPDLLLQIDDLAGRSFADVPTLVKQITTPAGFDGLDATQELDYDFPGGGVVRARVFGQVAGAPASVSICLYGMLSWRWVD